MMVVIIVALFVSAIDLVVDGTKLLAEAEDAKKNDDIFVRQDNR